MEKFFKEMYHSIWQGNNLSMFDTFYAKNFQETISVSDQNQQPIELRMNYHELAKQAQWQKENYTDTTLDIKKIIASEDGCIAVHFYSSSIDKKTGQLRHRSVCGIWHLNEDKKIDRVWAVVTPFYS